LAAGETFVTTWTIEILDAAGQVAAVVDEAARQQGDGAPPVVHAVVLSS
jgi:hypothetical protein